MASPLNAGEQMQQQPAGVPTAAPASAPAGNLQFSDHHVEEFATKLNMAIAAAVPEEQFAEAFIAQAGPDNVRAVIHNIPVERIVATVGRSRSGNTTYIATRSGRKYLEKVWQECRRLVGG
jgi:hypothetical protein